MKNFLEFTSSKGTEFLLAWNSIVSIAFLRENKENGTKPCALVRVENAGTVEREFASDAELEKFKAECRLNMSDEKICYSGDPENMGLICPISREACMGVDCAVWVRFASTNGDMPVGYCGMIHGS